VGFFEIFAAALAGFYALVPSLGLAIIFLTVVVRLLLLPLSIKQTRSMREMQLIQPEVKKLQAKYKGDRQKTNEAVMALYKEHNVNPFGGCLPLLMQFPVLIGLFYVIRSPLKYMGYNAATGNPLNVSGIMEAVQDSALARGLNEMPLQIHQFLGIRLDCSASAALSGGDPSSVGEACGSGFVSSLPYLILVLLMGFTTYYQQKQMTAQRGAADSPQAQQMQMFTRILPVMLMFFSFSFPTGVVLYWLTTNVWTIGQQRLMLRAAPPLTAETKTSAKRPATNSTPGILGRFGRPRSTPPAGTSEAEGDGQARPKTSKPHPSSKKKKKR
jgi:YidC/Oxa1 family membrane protein insertase